ncbi:MAG: hypothetical protein D6785_06515 [Planctomycetota bacterium]|nr:MAG: hypothetical protein D6785_06515 [Planctomycetota bacterium]
MKKFLLLSLLTLLAGCVSWGGFNNNGFSSKTILKESGYNVVGNVSAKSKCMYILGSILLDDTKADLYKNAFKELRTKAQLDGKARALANVTTDIVVKNYLVVKFVELTVTADVVEFNK